MIECEKGRVNLDELLGLGSFSLSNVSHMVDVLSDDEVKQMKYFESRVSISPGFNPKMMGDSAR